MKLDSMGCSVEVGDDYVTVSRSRALVPTDIQTLPHPGFPTDLQAQFMLLAALALYSIWWRCPHCGKFLGRKHEVHCRYCGRAVDRTAKNKKKDQDEA